MKKTFLRSALLVTAGVAFITGSASAGLVPYWSLTDFTTGTDGTINTNISFENINTDNISFGLFDTNAAVTAVDQMFAIFRPGDSIGFNAVASFVNDGGLYDIQVDVYDGASIGPIRTTTIDDFDGVFGFYFDRNGSRQIYSDSQFNNNVGGNTMTVDPFLNGTVNSALARLYFTGSQETTLVQAVTVGDVAPVPEPATMLLFGAGLAGLAGASRRKK